MKIFSEETKKKMSDAAKKRCTPEWRKQSSEMQSTKLDLNNVTTMYESGMTQDEIASSLNVTQKVIYNFMKRNGIETRVAAKRDQTGENNHMWNGGKKIHSNGYIMVRIPDHPRSHNGYVFEHILVAEKMIGRYLIYYGKCNPKNEIVHHKNEVKNDNSPDNLQVMTHSEHIKLHNKLRKEKLSQAKCLKC
ncbi:MAG: HNH endonuclease signature motif containing protein [Paenibacillaceae bacterium]